MDFAVYYPLIKEGRTSGCTQRLTRCGLEKVYGSSENGFVGYRLENADILIETEEPSEFESGRYLGFSLEVGDIASFCSEYSEKGVQFTGPPEK